MFLVFAKYFKISLLLPIKSIYFLKVDEILYRMNIISYSNNKLKGNKEENIRFTIYYLLRSISPLYRIFFSKTLHYRNPCSFAEKSLTHFFLKHNRSEIVKLLAKTLLKNVFFATNTPLTLPRGVNI